MDNIVKELVLNYKKAEKESKLSEFYTDLIINNIKLIPYIFWLDLIKWINKGIGNNELIYLFKSFINSNEISENELKNIKGLLCIFMKTCSSFDYDKIMNIYHNINNEEIKNWMSININLVAKNANVINIYKDKLILLQNYLPNFDYYFMSLNQIEQIIS